MTDQTRNVELVIRAKNLSKKTLNDVRKEIEDVNQAIDDQVAASKRGQGSMKDLEKSYGRLEDAMKALLQQQAVVKNFEAQQVQLEKLQAKLGAASTKLREHQAAMEASATVTKRQTTQLTAYQTAVDKADAALAKQAARLADARKEGEALGLTMNNLVGAQDAILRTGRQLSDVYDAQASAVDKYSDNMNRASKEARELADTQEFATAAAAAARRNLESEYSRFFIAELEKREAAERATLAAGVAAAERAAKQKRDAEVFDAAANKAADQNRRQQTELELTQLFDQRDAIDQLNRMADGAVAASRGFTTLADSSKRLVQNNRFVASSLRDIIDPASQARATIGGVEQEVEALSSAIGAISGPVKAYREQVRQLNEVQRTLVSQGTAIDNYDQQVAALRAARAQFSENRAELLQYAAAVRSSAAPTDEMSANLARLQAALARSSAELQTQINRTRQLRDPLRAAGIDTARLNAEQARLVAAANRSNRALSDLTGAMEQYGEAAGNAEQATTLFESNGRTTLSFVQRLRGEVLALIAAYAGLQGVTKLAQDSILASSTKEGLSNQLALSVGNDPAAIAAEYAYIREQAERIGVAFESTAKGYAKFAAAASLAGRGNKEIRYVAESFLEVGRVANLTADEVGGVFKALEQIYSKGSIQAEELRGQLGDRLFGAFEIAAIALKDQFPDLGKAMKEGKVTADQLLAVAEQYKKTVAEQLPTAMASLAANQQRLNSAFFDFKVLIAESGFAKEYDILIQRITTFFKSEDGARFAKNLGEAFGAISKVLVFIIDHLDEITLALELALGIKALALVAGFANMITTTLLPALQFLITQLTAVGIAGMTAAQRIQAAFLVLAAFFAGWQFGKYLTDQFEEVRMFGVALVIGLMKLFEQLKFAAQVTWTAISAGAQNSFNAALNTITEFSDEVLMILAFLANAAGKYDLEKAILGKMSNGVKKEVRDTTTEIGKLADAFKKEMANIDQIGFELFQDARDKPAGAAAPGAKPTEKPTIIPGAAKGDDDAAKKAQKEYEKLVAQRIALADELVRALEAAETKIQRNEKLSLEQRLAAIDTEYAKVFRKLDELAKLPGGKEQAATMRSTLTTLVAQLKTQETLKFNTEEMARKEKAINDLLALRQQLLTTIAAQQKAGTIPQNKVKEAIANVDSQINPQIAAAVAAARQFALSNQQVFGDQTAMDTYLAKLDAISAGLVTVSTDLYTLDQANQDIAGGLTNAFDQFAQSIAAGESAIDSLKGAFLGFVADFLKKIALMIIQQIILNALQNSNIGGMIAGGVSSVGKSHSGSVVGSGGAGGTKVMAQSSWFNNAPRYHSGGVAGLAADEYPTILQRNEEVLTANDPRNVMNGGAATGGNTGAAPVQDVTINNHVDAESFMSAALAGASGRKMIMNVLSAERAQLKTLVR